MTPRITAGTLVAGVVGHPVRHSLSPIIHNAWLEAAGIDAVYLAFAIPEAGFRAFVEGLRGQAILGLNVTIPFKAQAAEMADHRTDMVSRAGAANVLEFRPSGELSAYNTDGEGLLAALAKVGFEPRQGPVAVLGAGGAARGAAIALVDAGAPQVRIVNRTPERARAIAALDPRISVHGWDGAAGVLEGVAAIVNATSLGMAGQAPLVLPLEAAPVTAVVMDMVYKPLETELLRAAHARGMATADGLSMLIGQAVPSFRILFDIEPPGGVDVRRLCEAALGERR